MELPAIPSDLNWREFLIEQLIRLTGASAIGFVLLIFLFLIREGAPALLEVPLSNLVGLSGKAGRMVYRLCASAYLCAGLSEGSRVRPADLGD